MNKLYYILVVLICTVGFGRTGVYTSFSTGEISPDLHGRIDARRFYSGCRILENMFVWAQGPVEKRSGTYFIAEVGGDIFPAEPSVPGLSRTYTLLTLTEHQAVYYFPLEDASYSFLDAQPAVDLGGGDVGIPMTGHPYAVGDTVKISNTTNYNNSYVLQAGTTANQLAITATYNAETFNGDEPTLKKVVLTDGGYGHSAGDTANNIYYGHNYNETGDPDNYFVTRVATDGTVTFGYDFLNHNFTALNASDTLGVRVVNNYLFFWTQEPYGTPRGYMYKFDLATGNLLWKSPNVTLPFFEMVVDSLGNAYAISGNGVTKFNSSDGTVAYTNGDIVTPHGTPSYAFVIDEALGILVIGGYDAAGFDVDLYNLWVVDITDGTVLSEIAVGGTYEDTGVWFTYKIGVTGIQIYNGEIYVLCYTPTSTLYKYNTSLVEQATAAGPTDAQGLFFDLWGNLVVVNQDLGVSQTDYFHFYDTSLNSLAIIDGFSGGEFAWWDAAIGGAIHSGDEHFNGILATGSTPGTPAISVPNDTGEIPARLLSFDLENVIEAGHKYMRFYKDIQ